MKWIEEKMKLLGVTSNPNYKIAFHVDSLAMIRVDSPGYGVVDVSIVTSIHWKYILSDYKIRSVNSFLSKNIFSMNEWIL